jgi:hypothetical protein
VVVPERGCRYVVLHHTGVDVPHFDVMLERPNGMLRTFRSPVWPIEAETVLVEIEQHRHAYLDYEGPVSGNRGSVNRVEGGRYVALRKRSIDRAAGAPPLGLPETWKLRLFHTGGERVLMATVLNATDVSFRPLETPR